MLFFMQIYLLIFVIIYDLVLIIYIIVILFYDFMILFFIIVMYLLIFIAIFVGFILISIIINLVRLFMWNVFGCNIIVIIIISRIVVLLVFNLRILGFLVLFIRNHVLRNVNTYVSKNLIDLFLFGFIFVLLYFIGIIYGYGLLHNCVLLIIIVLGQFILNLQ
jgi:hypothetical protein